MQKTEKIIVLVLIILAFLGISVSYYSKTSPSVSAPLTAMDLREAKESQEMISENMIVDINSASKHTLTKLTGIGPLLAGRIIKYRRENGEFTSKDQILKVNGIGPKKYESIKKYIRL